MCNLFRYARLRDTKLMPMDTRSQEIFQMMGKRKMIAMG